MPKKKVLSFKPPPRLKQVGDNRPKQMKDRKHRIANPHGWIFRERHLSRTPHRRFFGS
jgi:hypothetical protein